MAQRETSSVRLVRALASVGGLGHLPWAPGTWATLLALALAFLLSALSTSIFVALTVLLLLAAVAVAGRAADDASLHDPGWIVIDEVVGAFVSVSLVARSDLGTLALAALLFRLFDITKPWPIRRIERQFPGGWGIVLDDVAAGLYALACLTAFKLAR